MDAARAWAFARAGRADPARSATVDDDVQEQFAALGIEVDRDEVADDAVDVWDINARSVRAFIACGTQWRVAVGGSSLIWLGLDYAGVDVVLRRQGAPSGVFDDVCVMERAALTAFNEARS